MSLVRRLFVEHPASVNETYFEHLVMAMGFGLSMVLSGIACMIHGLIPAAFVSRGSDTICSLYQRMVTNRIRRDSQVRVA